MFFVPDINQGWLLVEGKRFLKLKKIFKMTLGIEWIILLFQINTYNVLLFLKGEFVAGLFHIIFEVA